MKQSLSRPLQTALIDKLVNSAKIKNFCLTVFGKSMRPLLKEGMEIKFRKIGPRRLPAVGDVAAVKYRNGLLVHRILRIRGPNSNREYFTKGDRRLAGDGWVGKDRMMGIMIRGKRYQRIMDLATVGFSFMLWGCGKLLRWRRR